MRNILLTISYDGTGFSGWQRQDGQRLASGNAPRTVQAELERALAIIHKADTPLAGSGRTDAGVHAAGQTATFLSPVKNMAPEKYIPALNSHLSRDIRVMKAIEVSPELHARFSATFRTYRYFIHCGGTAFAHLQRYVWSVHRYPQVAALNRMASFLRGEIDCSAFAAAGDKSGSKFRYLEKAVFYTEGSTLVFEITANAFLWKMVRSITGTLLHLEQKGCDWQYFGDILASGDRALAGPTAPPQGLFLWSVSYEGKRRGRRY